MCRSKCNRLTSIRERLTIWRSTTYKKLALLDRAWLRLLAVEFARQQPTRKAEADALVEQLAGRDREAKHVLIQLRDGHETILRMWLLRNRTD